ncbi:hypothetical protein SAMN02910317_02961 [Ruminococcaceae bacterium FB2012]|jgi:hypothetical protein|nr:hypothetical protein SAMN02910317_02961 [Ruminococcaceae bacterium FB2012]
MNDYNIETALKALGRCTPKAPEETVEAMVKTVRALNAEKARRAAAAGKTSAADKQKELTPRAELKAPGAKKVL